MLSGDDSAGLRRVRHRRELRLASTCSHLLGAAVGFVWDAVCTKQFGGTPMKLAFGMKVVRAENGADVEWEHAIKRWALPGALALIPHPGRCPALAQPRRS